MKAHSIESIVKAYFSDPSRQLHLVKGEVLISQDYFNDRLFYVIKGSLDAMVRIEAVEGSTDQTHESLVFKATPKTFIGVYSFFSKKLRSPLTVTATMDTILAYIDISTPAINCAEYGDLAQQFMPVIVEELSTRQMRSIEASYTREVALKNLHENRQLAILGEMAAGVTHELNNVMAVIERNSHSLAKHYLGKLPQFYKNNHSNQISEIVGAFGKGLNVGQKINHQAVREVAQKMMDKFSISYDCAKRLSAMYEGTFPKKLPDNYLDQLLEWEVGREWHDLQRTSLHASKLLKSIKLLVRTPEPHVAHKISNSLNEAINLMRHLIDEEAVTLILELGSVPEVLANPTELIQVWVNLIKNAIEAMQCSEENERILKISLSRHQQKVIVTIANNGPSIPKSVQERIFTPCFTTKTKGQTIGLGLGLSIVKRIVNEHDASIILESESNWTNFMIIFNVLR